MIEDIYLDELNRLLFCCEFDYYVHYSCTKLDLFQFWLHFLKVIQNTPLYLSLPTLQLREVAPLVILCDSIDLIVIEETSKFLHPFAVYPFPSPHIQQSFIGSTKIFLIQLLGYPFVEIEEIIDVDLYSLAFAEYFKKLLARDDLYFIFALLQKIAIDVIDEICVKRTLLLFLQNLYKISNIFRVFFFVLVSPTIIFGAASRQFKETSFWKVLFDKFIYLLY